METRMLDGGLHIGKGKGISYNPKDRSVNASGGTKEVPINFKDVNKNLGKDPHYILDNFKKLRPEVYRHIVGLLISLYKE